MQNAIANMFADPTYLQRVALKWLAVVGVVLALCVGSFFYGKSVSNDAWQAKLADQRADVSDRRADNAVDVTKRFGHYTKTQADLDAAVAQAKAQITEHYNQNPEVRTVEVVKLIPVPGKEEYVYVPIGTCPNDFLDADELRLWNLGREGYVTDPSRS